MSGDQIIYNGSLDPMHENNAIISRNKNHDNYCILIYGRNYRDLIVLDNPIVNYSRWISYTDRMYYCFYDKVINCLYSGPFKGKTTKIIEYSGILYVFIIHADNRLSVIDSYTGFGDSHDIPMNINTDILTLLLPCIRTPGYDPLSVNYGTPLIPKIIDLVEPLNIKANNKIHDIIIICSC